MNKYSILILVGIALYIGGTTLTISCNNSSTQNQNPPIDSNATKEIVDSAELRSAATTTVQQNITSLVYTELQAQTQYKNTPGVKKPLDTFWYNIQPNFAVNGQLHEIGESMEYFMKDINNNLPFKKRYSWEYSTSNLRGQYLYVTDRNKAIVPNLQYSLDTLFASECKEFGFRIDREDKNITGYYQKFSIKK